MSECKHGLRAGCAYCHVAARPASAVKRTPAGTMRAAVVRQPAEKRSAKTTKLSDKMNDRMTALNRRLKELRGNPTT